VAAMKIADSLRDPHFLPQQGWRSNYFTAASTDWVRLVSLPGEDVEPHVICTARGCLGWMVSVILESAQSVRPGTTVLLAVEPSSYSEVATSDWMCQCDLTITVCIVTPKM
jgi:hypothetical protein